MADDDARYDLIEAACAFWFQDGDQVRTPFPPAIHADLKRNAQRAFLEWLGQMEETDRGELTDDELASLFELILFREAQALVGDQDPDLLLTLHHPFMPRLGDRVEDANRGPSRVEDRKLEEREDKKLYLILTMVAEESGERWDTEFVIPA